MNAFTPNKGQAGISLQLIQTDLVRIESSQHSTALISNPEAQPSKGITTI